MAETVKVLSEQSITALKRDHERLRYEVSQLRAMVRAFMSETQDGGMKPLCRFTLSAALATSESSKSATMSAQYGKGRSHPSTSITVYNLLSHTAGTYVFEGDSGDAGYAYYDTAEKKWYIIQMECP